MTHPVLAITPGEPAGIGPELLLRFHREHPDFRLLAVADPDLLRQTATALALDVKIREWQGENELSGGEINCLPVRLHQPARPGILDPRNSAYVLDTLRHAVRLVVEKQAAALVTGPVHKGVINEGGFSFTGHTEFLAELAGGARVVMMLAAPGLRVALVTTHLPLRNVADALTAEKLEAVIRITHDALRLKFGIDEIFFITAKIEQTAQQQRKRQDIDCQNASCQRRYQPSPALSRAGAAPIGFCVRVAPKQD